MLGKTSLMPSLNVGCGFEATVSRRQERQWHEHLHSWEVIFSLKASLLPQILAVQIPAAPSPSVSRALGSYSDSVGYMAGFGF